MVNHTKKKLFNNNNKTKKIPPYVPFEKQYMDDLEKNKKYKGLKNENVKLKKN